MLGRPCGETTWKNPEKNKEKNAASGTRGDFFGLTLLDKCTSALQMLCECVIIFGSNHTPNGHLQALIPEGEDFVS